MTKQKREELKKLYHACSIAVDQNNRNNLEMKCWAFLKEQKKSQCFKLIPFFKAKEHVETVAIATGDVLKHLAMAMKCLEQYTLNIIRKPWCEDYHIIKTYNGYFKYNIERWISRDIAFKILELSGYQEKEGEILKVSGKFDQERVVTVSFELYLAQLLIKFYERDRHSVYHLMDEKTSYNYVSQQERHTVPNSSIIMKSTIFTASSRFDKDGETIQPFVTALTSRSSNTSQSENPVSLETISDDQLYDDVGDTSGSDNESGVVEPYLGTHHHGDDRPFDNDINHQGHEADNILKRRLRNHDQSTRV